MKTPTKKPVKKPGKAMKKMPKVAAKGKKVAAKGSFPFMKKKSAK